MRTKSDKDQKKAASQRMQFNVSLPSVVLDASDCAKLLDGTGKTSVIVVEREGKIVPASSLPAEASLSSSSSLSASKSSSSAPSISSSSSSPTTSISAKFSSATLKPRSKLCKEIAQVSASTSDNVAPSDCVSLKAAVSVDSGHLSRNTKESSISSEKDKVILKPPKKRRGNDKGAYEDVASTPVLNGEGNHPLLSPLRDFTRNNVTDISKPVSSSSSSFSPAPADSLQKHTIENLLQSQSPINNNNTNSNNNNLISGRISHRPYESCAHQLPQAATPVVSIQTTLSSVSSLQPPSLSPSLSPLSNSKQTDVSSHSSSSMAYIASAHKGMSSVGGSSLLYSNSSSLPLPSQSVEDHSHLTKHYTGSSENSELTPPSSIHPPPSLSTSPAPSAIHQPSFQRLPVQDEPMNLSKSSKTANSSLTPGLCEAPAENESAGPTSSSSHAVQSTEDVHSGDMTCEDSVSVLKNNSKVFIESNGPTIMHQENHVQEQRVTNSVTSECDLGQETVGQSSRASSLPKEPVEPLPSPAISSYHSESPITPQSSKQLISETSGKRPQSNQESINSSHVTATSDSKTEVPEDHDATASSLPVKLPSSSQSSSSIPCTVITSSSDADSVLDKSKNVSEGNKDTSASDPKMPDKEAVLKVKKPPKKRVEIPMDEESCANRLALYTGSINCVITDFVFIPEPAEEISLTEEEEAIIRKQFENEKAGKSVSLKGNDDKRNRSVSKIVDTSDLEKENSDEIKGPVTGTDDKKDSDLKEKDHVIKPPKKRANAVKNALPKKSSEAVLSAIANVESVLAFVAADITNYTPPSEEGLLELDEKYGHLLKKKKKKIFDAEHEEGKQIKDLNDDKTTSPQKKKMKTLKTMKTESSQSQKEALLPNKVNPEQLSVSTSTESLEKEDLCDPAKTSKEIKPKSKAAKKRKLDSRSELQSNQDTSVPKHDKEEPSTDSSVSKPKKKKVDGKIKSPKKKKSEKSESAPRENITTMVERPISQTSEDRDLLSSVKMETSDLGESIASVSGGSEQVTPVHEPETKDEGTNTDQGMDKENLNDTGVESSSDDKEKPVRHYKRRLDFVKCSQCDHQARGRSALSRHMKKVHLVNVDMPYKCTLCTYGCTKMASLNRHLFTHGIFPCSRCDFKTDTRDKLTDHIAEQHKDKLDMKLCKICNRYIKCENVTIEKHSENCQGPTPFKCTECNKEFKYGSSLRVHYHTHFPDEPKRFKCELCDYKTNYKANLHKHHKNMHASKDRDIQCPDCGKMFSTEDNMRRHRKVHTLARPFACETCKKTFKTSGALKGHQLIHTATRPFTCNIPGCNRSFRTPKFLKSHQEEFHRLVPKKFFCQVEGCNYSFFKRSHLKRHAITHTGERNFHCTWPGCSKSFRHADNLKVHFRSHSNEKPVQCHLCDFKCKQKNSLFWHKKKVHQIVDASTITSKRADLAEAKKDDSESKEISPGPEASLHTRDEKSSTEVSTSTVDLDSPDTPTKGQKSSAGDGNLPDRISSQGKLIESNDSAANELTTDRLSSVVGKEREPTDLYEFKSDDESGDEGISPLREKIKTAVMPPLPPPPKELLLKNEMQEQKEREKHERAERKEQERKEKADRKEQEKKEKTEKKEREKKEKAEKKELEKKEKEEKREKEKKEREEKKVQEKKERVAKKEKEKKERERRRLEVKRLKLEARKILQKGSALKKKKASAIKLKRDVAQASSSKTVANAKEKKSKAVGGRRKSPSRGEPAAKPKPAAKTLSRGRKKKNANQKPEQSENTKSHQEVESTPKAMGTRRKRSQSGKGTPKEEIKAPFSRSSSPRAASRKSPAPQKIAPTKAGRSKAATPPKRKPSARIKANNKKAKAKKAKFTAKKTTKPVAKKKPGKKKSVAKPKNSAAKEKEEQEEEDEEENTTEEVEAEKKTTDDNESLKSASTANVKEDAQNVKEGEDQMPSRPVSPAYSEEIMLQGKASPYRDFSDAENLEEENAEEKQKAQTPLQSPKEEDSIPKSKDSPLEESPAEDRDVDAENKVVDDGEEQRDEICLPDDSSDDEVINDIPLTPPRAPAPPPPESSEDEMEPELDKGESCQPFSVPAPNTPFSVPGPNTPFSVPPPTNLMQQHSVHSEEMPMSAAVPSVASMETPSVEMQQAQGSVELHPHGSVELHPHGSVELHPHGSVELHPHGSVELHPHGSVELHPHGSVELHPHGSVELHPHSSVEMHPNSSVEMNQSHGSVEMQPSHGSISEPMSQPEPQIPQSNLSGELPLTPREGGAPTMPSHDKYNLPPVLEDGQTSEADRKCFDQYFKTLNAVHNNMECSPPSDLQQLEAMVDKSHSDSRDLMDKSPQMSQHHPALHTSVITSLENTLPHMPQPDLRARIDPLTERHHESLYTRDTMSALPRFPERQSTTPLLSNHTTPTPAFDTFSSLNPLHPSSVSSRDNSYLRQQESIFATPPVTSSFMAEAMFQRQAMTTPFLPPAAQPADRSSLSRISDPASTLRTNNTSASLLRRPTTMPGTDMFTAPTVPQTMPRHPFTNVWPGQDVRPTHWQSPYLPRQPNMGHTNSPFFPPKENYLTGREFMFDPSSVRSSTERGMFSSLSSSQSQDSFQMDRFDISNYFPNPMAPYGSSTGTLDYTRSTHTAGSKPFDERYRQTAAAAATASIPEFRSLPPTTAAPEMFPSIGVNSGFNLYPSNPMSYHPQHMTENMNSAFLTHPSSAQHVMLERDYAAAAAHRGLYSHHQNTTYPFIDERQYSGTSKLASTHPTAATATQERDLMTRTAAPESQMQDPYRSMLYRY